PENAGLGETSTVKVSFRDENGRLVKGLQPVRIDIVDPKGHVHEDSNWIALENGEGKLSFTPAWNDPSGTWKIQVSDLTAGLSANASLTLKPNSAQ
ncbi:MAG TPA: MG2 domain-containing protein, partial [Terrimicrobiaceae bacterium]|nr:MG2 domain-containing protein [Terrimicrobiaceae bacterium]